MVTSPTDEHPFSAEARLQQARDRLWAQEGLMGSALPEGVDEVGFELLLELAGFLFFCFQII